MGTPVLAIKTMKLYTQVERVFNELAARGIAEDAPLAPADLSAFDQYHYLGHEPVDDAIRLAGLGRASRVLDLGSGLGGPARHLAATAGCRVTAIELQPDLDRTAALLTRRCGLEHLIEHVEGDIMAVPIEAGTYDLAGSWLVFLHLPDRAATLARIRPALKPGGWVHAEDFFERGRLGAAEWADLRREVWAQSVPTMAEWRDQVRAAGFADIRLHDMTGRWAPFVAERLALFRTRRARNIAVHGRATTDALDVFYATMDKLFKGGNLGGIRMVARAP